MDDYSPLKGVRTQVFDKGMRAGNMLVSGKMYRYAIQATRERPNKERSEHRPFLARGDTGAPWTDSIAMAELFATKAAAQRIVDEVEWDCPVQVARVLLYIGKVEPV